MKTLIAQFLKDKSGSIDYGLVAAGISFVIFVRALSLAWL